MLELPPEVKTEHQALVLVHKALTEYLNAKIGEAVERQYQVGVSLPMNGGDSSLKSCLYLSISGRRFRLFIKGE